MKKIIVVVCIYKRYENLKKWIHAWKQSNTENASLFFVNNADPDMDTTYWEQYCKDNKVGFVRRENIGFETGIIQDVILGRMFAEQNWDLYLSVTDDTIPMDPYFLYQFREAFKPDVGIVCMEMSGVFTPHIRTTGFCIDKYTAKKIKFKQEQIKTKEECYYFEHQGKEETLLSQILRMNKVVVQLSGVKKSVLWDTHHHENHNRWKEWNKVFPGFKEDI